MYTSGCYGTDTIQNTDAVKMYTSGCYGTDTIQNTDAVKMYTSGCYGTNTIHNTDAVKMYTSGCYETDTIQNTDAVKMYTSGCYETDTIQNTDAVKKGSTRVLKYVLYSDTCPEICPVQRHVSLNTSCTATRVFLHRLYLFICGNGDVSGFIPDVPTLFTKYRLEQYLTQYAETKTFSIKLMWINTIKSVITSLAARKRHMHMEQNSDFVRFIHLHTDGMFRGWIAAKMSVELSNAFFLAKLVTCIPETGVSICRKCHTPFIDTIEHIVQQMKMFVTFLDYSGA
ncbi:unnamed protein product [Mytilus coruscus]|uniref:Uncharacterized protein n=1 Tax=Mytilus coruscus TaxID=42192 RepID=A0A6J8AY70_MYTCO|nr:unnamed protein product [Mytilus coruscus]